MSKRSFFIKMITSSLIRRRSRMLVALLAIAVGGTILSGLVTIYYDVPRQMNNSQLRRQHDFSCFPMMSSSTRKMEEAKAIKPIS